MFPDANSQTVQRATQNLSALSAEALRKITSNLNNTLWLGILTGFSGIIGYTLNLQKAGWKILFLFILIASASYISGFFFGFSFWHPQKKY